MAENSNMNYSRLARISLDYDVPFRQVMSDADKLLNNGFDYDSVIEELCNYYEGVKQE